MMDNYQIYGEFQEALPNGDQFLVISFSPSSIPLQQRWRNNGLSADFVADYLTAFFPASEGDPNILERRNELRSAVSYIANELLENAMKFHNEAAKVSIQFGIYLLNDTVVLFSKNCISSATFEKFQKVIQELTTTDPEELYISHLEKLAEQEDSTSSGLGLITIVHDYLAKLGWKIEPLAERPELNVVTTMVQLEV